MNSENLTLLAVGLPALAALVTAVAVLVRRRGPGSTDDAEGTSTTTQERPAAPAAGEAVDTGTSSTVGADASAINCIKSGEDVSTGKAKSEAGDATLTGLSANGTPFVWDGTKAVNYQDATWLTKLLQ